MGKTIIYRPDPNNPAVLTPEEEARLDSMTDEELEAAALADPDNQPLSDEILEQLSSALSVKRVRHTIGLSQEDFAARFGFSVGRVRDWEQGRSKPDKAAMNYLRVIEQEPEAVQRALSAAE